MIYQSKFTAPERPLVSIGLPVYNGENYIKEAVESLRKQTYSNLEIIISDNCSTDNSFEICKALCLEDSRIKISRTSQNVGAAKNFNLVVGKAQGEFFAWANHDDLWDETYVEKCLAALLNDESYILAYSKSKVIDEFGEFSGFLNGDLHLDGDHARRRLRSYQDFFVDLDRRRAWNEQEPIEGLWIPIYGIMRTDLLKETSLIGKYIGSDTILIEELLMLGRFFEVNECLFSKRDHPQRSMRAAVPYEVRSEWFSGSGSTRFIFPRWHSLFARVYWSAVLPKTNLSKLGCLFEMTSFYFRRPHERNALVKEVVANTFRNLFKNRSKSHLFEKW